MLSKGHKLYQTFIITLPAFHIFIRDFYFLLTFKKINHKLGDCELEVKASRFRKMWDEE